MRQVLESDAVARYSMQERKVTVFDGKYLAVDCKEIAFITAGRNAFLDATHHAGPLLLRSGTQRGLVEAYRPRAEED